MPVALEHAAGSLGAQPIVEPHVQEGETNGLGALDLGDEDERPAVAAAAGDGDLTLEGHELLGAPQCRVILGAGTELGAETAAVDDLECGVVGLDVAVDAVASEAGDLGDGPIERDHRAQCPVAEVVAGNTGGEQLAHQRHLEQALVRPGDPDRHGLGLVPDRVDGPGQLFDGLGQRGGEVLDDHAGRTDLAVVHLVDLERDRVGCIAQQRRHPHRGGGFKAAVVLAGTQGVEEPGAQPAERAVQLGERGVGIGIALGHGSFDGGSGLAHRSSRRVDRERGLVAEEVAHHRGEHERERRVDRRNTERVDRDGTEARLVLVGDGDGCRLVSPIDRQLLGDVVRVRARESGRAHQDEGLR